MFVIKWICNKPGWEDIQSKYQRQSSKIVFYQDYLEAKKWAIQCTLIANLDKTNFKYDVVEVDNINDLVEISSSEYLLSKYVQ